MERAESAGVCADVGAGTGVLIRCYNLSILKKVTYKIKRRTGLKTYVR